MPDIALSFIILAWNSERYLVNCFSSVVEKCTGENITFEVIAIDNGSTDSSAQIIQGFQAQYPGIFSTITLASNAGTTYPRNRGLEQARGSCVCILDSDTEIGEGNLAATLERLEADRSIGIIAPRLLLPDGTVQNSVKRFPVFWHKMLKILKIIFGIKIRNRDFYEDFPFPEERFADTAISACWLFRRELVEKIGYLDEKIFYSPEDLDYSVRAWKAGVGVLFYPSFTVLHHTQQITHKKPISKTSISHFKGLLYFYSKHGGWFKSPAFDCTAMGAHDR